MQERIFKTLSKVRDTLWPIDTFVFFLSFLGKKKKVEEQLAQQRKKRKKRLHFRSFFQNEVKKKKEGGKNTFTPIVGYGDNPRNLCLESEQASCNLTEAESCIDRHF